MQEIIQEIFKLEKEREGLNDVEDAVTFLMRLYSVYDAYRKRVSARNLKHFAEILDIFLPPERPQRLIKSFNDFQRELINAEVPEDIINDISRFCISRLNRLIKLEQVRA